jgi:hypothetical protein
MVVNMSGYWDNDNDRFDDYRNRNTIFDTEYYYRKEIVRNYRGEIIDSLIDTSDDYYRNTIKYESKFWTDENISDFKNYIVDIVCDFLKESKSIDEIRKGMKQTFCV